MNLLNNELLDSFIQIQKALYSLIKKDADRAGLTVVQVKALYKIHRTPDVGLRELAGSLKLTNSTMSGVVDRLVAHQLLERHTSSADRRAITLKLTRKGEEKLEEATGTDSSYTTKIMELTAMPQEDKDHLLRIHHLILDVLTAKEENKK
ncbi:MarR family winged helix-turn-helix transcriptional regulator [Fictibacillus terranigra]|uniref:MarR family transcriptional regulator n=1 Tax=Fictibacillus terranigra TaxID=3058424 RepID=A0ABT8E0P3_9BACL|nr:MarR family transcriptional regulator [Fictibacillus sp. CENA-BCM004]MDN4071484.1 MarR family transcriptional regulator [Fictibacillus sp. CENA-BCM004]